MNLADFDYHLPEELIAQRPAIPRDSARLMVIDRAAGTISHKLFRDIQQYLGPADVLAINTTRVFPARIESRKSTGGRVEFLLLARNESEPGLWNALVRGARKLKPGETVHIGPDFEITFVEHIESGKCLIRLKPDEWDVIGRYGRMPLPPYIKRSFPEADDDTDKMDRELYQTVFADKSGSCAAPTAGLHFTPELMTSIRAGGTAVAELLLHVGIGTFRPVVTERVEDHKMDTEFYSISQTAADAVNHARSAGGSIIAVGSTVTRTLETAAERTGRDKLFPSDGWTDKYILPGYKFAFVDKLVTNFHLPRSTLFILVCAFMGRDLAIKAYSEAVIEKYRFYSYGDAMLII